MFAWTDRPNVVSANAASQSANREAMYRRELEERAALLHRLGRSTSFIKSRLSANMAWDFDLHGKPMPAAEVDKLVDAVVRRLGKR